MANDSSSTDLSQVIAYADKVHTQLAAVAKDKQDEVLARLSQELLNHEFGLQAAYGAILTRAAGQRDGSEPTWLRTLRQLSDFVNPTSAFAELGGIVRIAWAWREPAVEYEFQELGSRTIARLARLATVLASWDLAVQRINAAMISRHLAAQAGRKFFGGKAIRIGLHFPGEKIRNWRKPLLRVDIECVLQNACSNPPVLVIGSANFPEDLDADIDNDAKRLIQSVADAAALEYTIHGLLVPSKNPTKRPPPVKQRHTPSKKQTNAPPALLDRANSQDGNEYDAPAEASPHLDHPHHPEHSGKSLPEHLIPQGAGLRLPTRAGSPPSPNLFVTSDQSDSDSSDGPLSTIDEHEEVQNVCNEHLPDVSILSQALIEPGNVDECSVRQQSTIEVDRPDLMRQDNDRAIEVHSGLGLLHEGNDSAALGPAAREPSPRCEAVSPFTSADPPGPVSSDDNHAGLESSVPDVLHEHVQPSGESTNATGNVMAATNETRGQPRDVTIPAGPAVSDSMFMSMFDDSQRFANIDVDDGGNSDSDDLNLPFLQDSGLHAIVDSTDFSIDTLSAIDFDALFSSTPVTAPAPLAASNDAQVLLDLNEAASRIENFMTKTSVHQTGPGPSSVNYAAVHNWITNPQRMSDRTIKVVDACDSFVILPQEPVHFTRLSASSIDLGLSTPAWKLLVLNNFGVLLEAAGSSYNWIRSAEGRQVCVVIEPKPANAAYPVILETGASLLLPHDFTYFVVQATPECIIQVVTYPKP